MSELREILERAGTVLLDDALDPPAQGTGAMLFQNPKRIITCSVPDDVPGCLIEIDNELDAGHHVTGYMSYEAGYVYAGKRVGNQSETDWEIRLGYPVLWFGIYDTYTRIPAAELDFSSGDSKERRSAPELNPRLDEVAFSEAISNIHSLIHEGDLYQLNFTFRLDGNWPGHPVELYAMMRARQPVAYGAYLNLGDTQILSASPEKFFSRQGAEITVRPMKGTAPRGDTPELDDMYGRWLECDQKNRSENLMILDLLRNDLSRICDPGTVGSDPVFTVEKYETVFQMVSGVKGELTAGTRYAHIFEALFPSGSITGAPKIRAMRRISEQENDVRGVYCGAIGYIAPDEQASFSVAIRTAVVNGHKLVTGSGGGIVCDSTSESEYDEALLKTRYLSDRFYKSGHNAVKIIESIYIRLNIDVYNKLNIEQYIPDSINNHIDRLTRSATALGYVADRQKIRSDIHESLATLATTRPQKMRVLLGIDGILEVTFVDLGEEGFSGRGDTLTRRIGIASAPVHSGNPFLYHKTTFRPDFERGNKEAELRGLDDVVFVNENGYLTETTICSIFLRHGNVWRTPPLTCGLLPGIGRALELKSKRNPVEEKLSIDDLLTADEIMLTNAVRGRMKAVLIRRDASV